MPAGFSPAFWSGELAYLAVDLRRGSGMDVQQRAVADAIGGRISSGQLTGVHISLNCSTWSPALCLSQDGGPPIGQYRGPDAPRGKPSLSPEKLQRCEADSQARDNSLALALQIHRRGGSVSIESSPDCKDSSKPWFRSGNGYSTADHYSYWDGEDMQTYIRETESVFVIPRCAAAEDDSNPGYQKYMTFLLNPAAARRAQLLRQLSDKGCTHRRGEHVRLRGNDVDGVSHSRKAEEYPPALSRAVVALHYDPEPPPAATADQAVVVAPPDAAWGGAVQPPSEDPPTDGRASGKRAPSGAPPQSGGRGGGKTRRRGGAQAFLVSLLACLTRLLVLLSQGYLPSVEAPQGQTGAVRTAAEAAIRAVLPVLLPTLADAPLHYAALRGEAPNYEHIIALFASAPPEGTTLAAVAIDVVADLATRMRVMAAVGLVADIYGDGRLAEPGVATDAIIGRLDYTGVAATPTSSRAGHGLFEERRLRDVAQTLELRRHLAVEAQRQAAAGDLDMASYLDEAIPLVRPAPAEEVSSAVRGTTKPPPAWLLYEPFRMTVVERSDPLPRPEPQAAPLGFRPTCKADLLTPECLDTIAASRAHWTGCSALCTQARERHPRGRRRSSSVRRASCRRPGAASGTVGESTRA